MDARVAEDATCKLLQVARQTSSYWRKQAVVLVVESSPPCVRFCVLVSLILVEPRVDCHPRRDSVGDVSLSQWKLTSLAGRTDRWATWGSLASPSVGEEAGEAASTGLLVTGALSAWCNSLSIHSTGEFLIAASAKNEAKVAIGERSIMGPSGEHVVLSLGRPVME